MKRKQKIIIIFSLALFLFLLYLGKSFLFVSRAKVITVLPLPQSEGVELQPEILVQFDQPVQRYQLRFWSQPDFPHQLHLVNQNRTLIIEVLEKLQPETTYYLALQLKEEFTWQFKTRVEAGSRQGWEEEFRQETEKYLREHQGETEVLKKLKEKLPYSTDEFRIEYAIKTNKFFIFLYQEPYNENKQKALSWLKNQGVEPDKLNILWMITNY